MEYNINKLELQNAFIRKWKPVRMKEIGSRWSVLHAAA